MRALLVAAVLILGVAASPAPETISLRAAPGPFCGKCTSVKIEVSSDGRVRMETGQWAGHYRDWRKTTKRWRVTPEQFAAFRERLALYRPKGALTLDRQPECDDYMTDAGEIVLSWRGGGVDGDLRYDLGCDPVTRREMREDIQTAPILLGGKRLPG